MSQLQVRNAPLSLIDRVQGLLDSVRPAAGRMVSVTLTIAALPVPRLPDAHQGLVWLRPDREEWWLGVGCSWRTQRSGEGHLAALAEPASELWERLDILPTSHPVRMMVWSESGASQLSLPTVQLGSGRNGEVWLTVTPDPAAPRGWRSELWQAMAQFDLSAESGREPNDFEQFDGVSQRHWLSTAERAISDIRAGTLDKLVLGRKVSYRAAQPISPGDLLQSLYRRNPNCTLYGVNLGDACWVGSSPEKLLECRDGRLYTEAVAGTVRRQSDQTADQALGAWLLSDAKIRHEHQLVVDGLTAAARPFAKPVGSWPEPRLLRLRGLQHLHTPLEFELRDRPHPLQIAQQLHPSPAVCGQPRSAAAAWLAEHEGLDRQAYTGLLGWIDNRDQAALNVMLRCYQVRDRQVDLYVGAGLVGDSSPLVEWQETELKMVTMLEALRDA